MFKYPKTTACMIVGITLLAASALAQLPDQILLNKPECANWDSLYNRYLISLNIDNDIVQVDQNGVVTMFQENCGTYITSAGIGGTTIYQSDVTKIRGYDLGTTVQNFYVEIPGAYYLGGPVADTSGNIYVPDMPSWGGGGAADMIWKVRVSDGYVSELVNTDDGLGFAPRDIVFDPVQNRLVVTFMAEPVYIQAISLNDSTITNLVRFETDYTNGIARDQFGNIFVGGYDNETVYRYDSAFSNPPETVSVGHDGPCNIDYNPRDHILVVPNYHSDVIDFVRIGRPKVAEVTILDSAGGDGDGVIESNESIEMVLTFQSQHCLPVTGLSYNLLTVSGGLTITQGSAVLGEIPPQSEISNSATPLAFDVPPDYTYQVNTLEMEISYTSDYGSETDTVTFLSHHDIDLDYVVGADDNCPSVFNPDQSDADLDAIGDSCDECTDTDGDGNGDPGFPANTCLLDNCPDFPDRLGVNSPDDDGDGHGANCDNCPLVSNADQTDADSDGLGDACDTGYTVSGTDVLVEVTDSLHVTFTEVLEPGQTSVTDSVLGPPPPEGFMLAPELYFYVQTTATHSGPLTVCFTYDEATVVEQEENLRIFHSIGEPHEFADVTLSLDTVANEICGEVASLSPFVLALPASCCVPPTVGDVDQSGVVDITDISVLIDNQFLTLTPLDCEPEGDVDFSGVVDISDVSVLIDNQFLTLTPLPPCS